MYPELLRLPWLGQAVHTYGVLIALGFVLATLVIVRDAKRAGDPKPERFADLAFSCLLVGLAGSRLLFMVVNWRMYVEQPFEVLAVWKGGLVFYGGFLAAMGFVLWWCRRNALPFFQVADRLILGVALNHVFGRLGCLAAGCCFGAPTDGPFGIVYPRASAPALLYGAHPVHPSPVYEALGELVIFFVLMWLRPRKRFDGQLLLLWLALYPLLRSAVELTRGDVERGFLIPGLVSTSQALSAFVAALALALFWKLRRRHA